jgi:hypothetical protein
MIYRWRRTAGVLAAVERGLVVGASRFCWYLPPRCPSTAARLAIVIQLQIPRIIWMLDFMAIAYACLGASSRPARSRAAVRRLWSAPFSWRLARAARTSNS